MTRRFREMIDRRPLQALAPEQLLLLTVFGGEEAQQRVSAELDRRAALRPKHMRASPQLMPQLRPAA